MNSDFQISQRFKKGQKSSQKALNTKNHMILLCLAQLLTSPIYSCGQSHFWKNDEKSSSIKCLQMKNKKIEKRYWKNSDSSLSESFSIPLDEKRELSWFFLGNSLQKKKYPISLIEKAKRKGKIHRHSCRGVLILYNPEYYFVTFFLWSLDLLRIQRRYEIFFFGVGWLLRHFTRSFHLGIRLLFHNHKRVRSMPLFKTGKRMGTIRLLDNSDRLWRSSSMTDVNNLFQSMSVEVVQLVSSVSIVLLRHKVALWLPLQQNKL